MASNHYESFLILSDTIKTECILSYVIIVIPDCLF